MSKPKSQAESENTQYVFMPQAVRHMYDDWAKRYDKEFKSRGYCAPSMLVSNLSETFNLQKPHLRILDVGIGTGWLSAFFRKINPSCHITGVDISSRMLQTCEKKGIADELVLRDFQKDGLPFADASFDVVASSGVFELLNEPQNVIAEMGRVLREGGAYSFSTYAHSPRKYNCNFHAPEDIRIACDGAALRLNEKIRFLAFYHKTGWTGGNPIFYDVQTGIKETQPFMIPE